MENENQRNVQNNGGAESGAPRGNHRGHRGGSHHHHGNRPHGENKNAVMQEARSEATETIATNNANAAKPDKAPQQQQNRNQNNNQNGNGKRHDRHGKNRHGDRRDRPEQTTEQPFENELRRQAVIEKKPAEEPIVIPEFDLAELPVVFQKLDDYPDDVPCAVVVGVRFAAAGKTYYFAPGDLTITAGQHVIVETARGLEYAEIIFGNKRVPEKNVVQPLRTVVRIATPEDDAANAENHEKEKDAFTIAQGRIEAHKLDMKLVEAQYAFDRTKLLFYFTSGGRVDFRDLVKDLASIFRTRIELRQIGIRDEARMLGGLGACGRRLCCSTFLPDFTQVAIKMVKEQNLSLNSGKISGNCGRLMCCLDYEYSTYESALKVLPPVGSTVETPDGVGTVIGLLPLTESMKVSVQEKNKNNEIVNSVKNYTAAQIRVISFAAPPPDDDDEGGKKRGRN